jgi:hypothetical protein
MSYPRRPREGGDPVITATCEWRVRWNTGSPAFAGDDGRGVERTPAFAVTTKPSYPLAARSFSFCALIDSRAWLQSASDQSRN